MARTNRLLARSAVAVAGTAVAAGALLAVSPLAMAADTPSPSPTPSLVGGSPATWSPLRATKADSGTTIRMVPEQALLFPGFAANAHFHSTNTKVFVVTDAEGTGPVTAVAGGHAVAPGRAVVHVTRGGKEIAHYTVVVTPRAMK